MSTKATDSFKLEIKVYGIRKTEENINTAPYYNHVT